MSFEENNERRGGVMQPDVVIFPQQLILKRFQQFVSDYIPSLIRFHHLMMNECSTQEVAA